MDRHDPCFTGDSTLTPVKNNNSEPAWDKVVALFREACLLRRKRQSEQADRLLNHELPGSIAEWSRLDSSDPASKRLRLDVMFQSEQRRLEDVWQIKDLLAQHLTETVVPHLMQSISGEIKAALSPLLTAAAPVWSPRLPAVRPHFDDIPAIIDQVLADQLDQSHAARMVHN